MKNDTYNTIQKMSRRDLATGLTMGWNNYGSLTPKGQLDLLPRLIAFEQALALRSNTVLDFPEVNGLRLDEARGMYATLTEVMPGIHGELLNAGRQLARKLEGRIDRLTVTEATIARCTAALRASEILRSSKGVL
jgi:hypothetical protein